MASGPLANSDFECLEFEATEHLTQPFTITVLGRTLKKNLKFKDLLGKPMGFSVDHGGKKRFFHGCLESIEHTHLPLFPKSDHTYYRLTLVPKFGLLRYTSDCRIFQQQSPLDIIKSLLKEHDVHLKDHTTKGGKEKRDFCVQYNESHFHFAARLMETYGIAYYFTMTESDHVMVLTDDVSGYKALSPKTYDYAPFHAEKPALNRIVSLQERHQVVPQGMGLGDFSFEKPDQKLYVNQKGVSRAVPGQVYTYPGGYDAFDAGENVVRLRLQAAEFQETLMKGETTIPALFAGAKFTVKHHPESTLNRDYIALEVHHRLTLGGDIEQGTAAQTYGNTVKVFPDKVTYRPPLTTPKPRIHGTQTALVTGKEGEEIWTETYGRVKVKFHWDIRSKADDTSSCWIRVAYPMAGQAWGFVNTPRVGQEVVVSFLDGDPDQPLVVGCVYNGTHHPPYLPAEPTKSTFKSNSSKGGEGFNELRFEDKKGEEEIYLHAQKDAALVVVDSKTLDIQTGSFTTTIHRGDRVVTLKGDDKPTKGKGDDILTLTKGSRTVELQAKGSGKGNLTTTLDRGDVTLTLKQGDDTTTLKDGNQHLTLEKGNRTVKIHGDNHMTVSNGDWTVEVKGGNITLKATGNATHDIKGNMKLSIGGNLDVKATGKIHLDAKMGITASGHAGGIKLDGLNVALKGTTKVDINAGALATLKGALVKIN